MPLEYYKSDFFNNIPSMVHVINMEDEIMNVSDLWLTKLGYDRKEVIGRKSIEFLSFKDQIKPRDFHFSDLKNEEIMEGVRMNFIHKSGKVIPVLMNVKKIKNRSSEEIGYIASLTDVTKEEKEKVETEKIINIFNQTEEVGKIASYEFDIVDGKYWWSDNFYKMFGYEVGEIEPTLEVGLKLIHNEDQDKALEAFNKALEGSDYYVQKRMLHKSGREITVEASGKLLFEKGEPVKLLAVLLDITEKEKNLKLIQGSEKKYKNLFNNSRISIWNEDFSEIIKELKKLKKQGVKDLDEYIQGDPDYTSFIFSKLVVKEVNEATIEMFEAEDEAHLFQNIYKTFGEGANLVFIDILKSLWNNKDKFTAEVNYKTLKGKKFKALLSINLPSDQDSYDSVPVTIQNIQNIKDAEEELRKSELTFRTLSSLAPIAIYRTDNKGNCMYVNEKWSEISGIPLYDALGNGWVNGVHPEDRDIVFEEWKKIIKEKKEWSFEYRFQHVKTKEEFWVYDVATAIYDDEKIIGYIGSFIDISDKIKSEQKVNETLEKFEKAQELSQIGSWEFDLTTLDLVWSKEHYRIFEIDVNTPSNQLYNVYRDRIHPEDIEELDNQVNKAIEKGSDFNYHHRILKEDGSIKYVVGKGKTIIDDKGVPIKAIGTVQDITEKTEKDLLLQEQQSIQNMMMETMAEGVAIYDSNFSPISSNNNAFKILKLTRDQYFNRDLLDKDWKIIDEFKNKMNINDFPVIKTFKTGKNLKNFIMGVKTSIHDITWISVSTNLIEITNKNKIKEKQVVVSFSDITDSIQKEESEKINSVALGALNEGIVIQAKDSSIIGSNSAACKVLGLSKDQLHGRTSFDPRWKAIKEDLSDFPGEEHPASLTLKNGVSLNGVIMGVHKPEGELRWISINSSPIYFNENNVKDKPDGVICTFNDITDKREVENKFKYLSLEYTNFKNTIFLHGDILVTDTRGIITDISVNYCGILKYSKEELLGKHTKIFKSGMHDEKFIQQMWNTIKKGQIWRGDFCNKTKNGDLVWIDTTIIPIKGENKEIVEYMSLRKDITEKKLGEIEILKRSKYLNLLTEVQNYLILEKKNSLNFDKITAICNKILKAERISIYKLEEDNEGVKVKIESVYPNKKQSRKLITISKEFNDLINEIGENKYAIKHVEELKGKLKNVVKETPIISSFIGSIEVYGKMKYICVLSFNEYTNFETWELEMMKTTLRSISRTIERKQIERKLIVSEEHYKSVFNSYLDVYFEVDLNGKVMLISPSVKEVFGYKPEELNQYNVFRLFEKVSDVHITKELRVHGEIENFKSKIKHKKGKTLLTESKIKAKHDSKGEVVYYYGVIRDVSQQETAKKELDQIKEQQEKLKISSVFQGQDAERKRVSKELHDGLGQLITVAKLRLEGIIKSQKESNDRREELLGVLQIIEAAGFETKRMSYGLLPSVLEDFGLKAGINKIVGISSVNTITKVDFVTNLSVENRFEENIEINIYRIVQELINNSLKHSKAKNIHIELYLDKTQRKLKLLAEDNGVGFDYNEVKKNNSFGNGLINIFERCRLIKATYKIESSKKEGMQFYLELDL